MARGKWRVQRERFRIPHPLVTCHKLECKGFTASRRTRERDAIEGALRDGIDEAPDRPRDHEPASVLLTELNVPLMLLPRF